MPEVKNWEKLIVAVLSVFLVGSAAAHSFKVLDTDQEEMVYPADRYLEDRADAGFSAPEFLVLGMDHIFSGTDHLLFLFSLILIPGLLSDPRGDLWSAVELVTAFTVGHALTIVASYYGLVSMPSVAVEGGIAASIALASLLAVKRVETEETLNLRKERLLVVLIGFVHGLGFASTLNSLSIPKSQEIILLASFNAGIEIAQVLILLPMIGGLYISGRRIGVDHTIKVSATLSFALAATWTVMRVLPVVGGIK